MFKFLTPTPDAVTQDNTMMNINVIKKAPTRYLSYSSTLLATMLAGILVLTGCQPQSVSDEQGSEKVIAEADKAAVPSDSATARIEQFQPLYVTQMQALQRRLQAEYEALQAADMPSSDTTLLTTNEPTTTDNSDATADSETDNQIATALNVDSNKSSNEDINTSTEVGERDLEVLKRISLEPQKSEVLTEAQIIERYQQAMQALYAPASTALSAQESDTLINITTLLPRLFEHPEIAQRVSIKSPALARLIVQHQVGQQIQAQQALDMQQMKLSQQQEFETLMLKFNDTIEDYDKQIAKYEQTLTEFQH